MPGPLFHKPTHGEVGDIAGRGIFAVDGVFFFVALPIKSLVQLCNSRASLEGLQSQSGGFYLKRVLCRKALCLPATALLYGKVGEKSPPVPHTLLAPTCSQHCSVPEIPA